MLAKPINYMNIERKPCCAFSPGGWDGFLAMSLRVLAGNQPASRSGFDSLEYAYFDEAENGMLGGLRALCGAGCGVRWRAVVNAKGTPHQKLTLPTRGGVPGSASKMGGYLLGRLVVAV